MPEPRTSLEEGLAAVERQLGLVDSSLLAAEPSTLQAVCADLRSVALAFASVREQSQSAGDVDQRIRRRLEAIAERLNAQRTGLARHSVVVDRALVSIMRPQAGTTYTVPGERTVFGIGASVAGAH